MAVDLRLNTGQEPLQGVVLCCTSISPEKRSELASIASQMGAVHKYDLTSDVTHLIVGDTDTPKYKFVAKERPDVKCLLPSWVEALRQLWMEDIELDFPALEAQHRLPTLHNLRICITGFEDLEYRKRLEDEVSNNGGEYRGNLTKDVTHLVAKEPSGAKYKYAMDWNIKIVAVQWLEQSIERGMILDETLFNLSLPPQERGRDAWIRRVPSTSSLGKRSFDNESVPNGPRKLRRIASARLNSQNLGLWTNIVNMDMKTDEQNQDQWSNPRAVHKSGVDDQPLSKLRSVGTSTESSEVRTKLSTTAIAPGIPPPPAPGADSMQKRGVFAGKRLCLHGFNEKKTLIIHKHLVSHDAEILPDCLSFTQATMPPPDNEFLLVPHSIPFDQLPSIPLDLHQPALVTDMWVERNLHRKQYINPEANVTNKPFVRFPIPGFEHLIVCSTRFEDVDLLHMSKTVKLMGATYDEEFSPKASVLVCNKVINGNEKLRHAQHWNVPTVTADWLWDCVRSGDLKDFQAYQVQPCQRKPYPESDKDPKQPIGQADSRNERSTVPNVERHGGQKSPNPSNCKSSTEKHNISTTDREKLEQDGTKGMYSNKKDCPLYSDTPPTSLEPTVSTTSVLREISPNSSPPKPPAPFSTPKASSVSPAKKPPHDFALSSVISSLLAHHQKARSSAASSDPANNQPQNQSRPAVRRKRQLFGRAPSNASNLSRASSVDTINTEGVGTPVELTRSISNLSTNQSIMNHIRRPSTTIDDIRTNDIFDPFASHSNAEHSAETENHELLQMTQLGYEDPDALAWREKVERKLGTLKPSGDGSGEGGGAGRKVREIGVVQDLTGLGTGPVGRRTRQAMGR